MTKFDSGDVVLVDLGMAAKTRPCVVLAANPDRQRNMSVVAPLTTEIRGGECEVTFKRPAWLNQESVVNVLGIAGIDNAKVIRRLAPFPPADFKRVLNAIADMIRL